MATLEEKNNLLTQENRELKQKIEHLEERLGTDFDILLNCLFI